MDRETQFAAEFRSLRALCDEAVSREERRTLVQSLRPHDFVESEHQVVFESIRALILRGPISAAQLRIHLVTRGFPDTDVEKYFPPAPGETMHAQPTGTAKP
jgi:hypothetical protein